MALSDKDIVITPNKGQASDPQVVFSGASASLGPQNITLRVYPNDSGSLSFEGSSGQLFSITNSLTGTIFSVNDVSGIPSIEVLDSGLVKIGQYTGNVLIGTGTDNAVDKLQVTGSIAIDNLRLDGNTISSIDTNGNIVLAPNGTGRTNVTNLTTTSPRIVTGINDTNGNELFLLTATASAVNELTIANAATGNAPVISATGGDTNVGITLTPKGTGVVTVSSALTISGTTKAAGQFYAGTTAPDGTSRLNFDGYFYATRFYGDGSNLTGLNVSATGNAIAMALILS